MVTLKQISGSSKPKDKRREFADHRNLHHMLCTIIYGYHYFQRNLHMLAYISISIYININPRVICIQNKHSIHQNVWGNKSDTLYSTNQWQRLIKTGKDIKQKSIKIKMRTPLAKNKIAEIQSIYYTLERCK